MKWIVIILAIIIIWYFVKFHTAVSKQRKFIANQGGVKTMFKTVIDGLLQYQSARIIQDNRDLVTVGGTFTDPILQRECGVWSIIIQPTFSVVNVKYRARIDLGGGERVNKMWNFPIKMDQSQILGTIKKEADKFDGYGIYK